MYFNTIRDRFNWEEKFLLQNIYNKFDRGFRGLIFEDKQSKVSKTNDKGKHILQGVADIRLYIDRMEIVFSVGQKALIFDYKELRTINPQLNERLEITYGGNEYRIIGSRKGVSGLEWEVAVNAIWKKRGEHSKLSSYIAQSFQ